METGHAFTSLRLSFSTWLICLFSFNAFRILARDCVISCSEWEYLLSVLKSTQKSENEIAPVVGSSYRYIDVGVQTGQRKMRRPRFELGTFCVLDRCDNRLRHRPLRKLFHAFQIHLSFCLLCSFLGNCYSRT